MGVKVTSPVYMCINPRPIPQQNKRKLNYRESQGESAPHLHMRRCSVHRSRTSRKKRMTKKSTKKLAKQPCSWTPLNIFKEKQLRQMKQKNARRKNVEFRVSFISLLFGNVTPIIQQSLR